MPSVLARAHLRDTITGIERWTDHVRFDDGHAAWWCWIEGNYQCDCNRFMFLYPDSDEEIGCSDGRIEMLSLEVDGKHVTSDAEEMAALERIKARMGT